MMMKIPELHYEELVLLQNIMWHVYNNTDFIINLDKENQDIFTDLYDKVMTA